VRRIPRGGVHRALQRAHQQEGDELGIALPQLLPTPREDLLQDRRPGGDQVVLEARAGLLRDQAPELGASARCARAVPPTAADTGPPSRTWRTRR
jgi:hypothetical protein